MLLLRGLLFLECSAIAGDSESSAKVESGGIGHVSKTARDITAWPISDKVSQLLRMPGNGDFLLQAHHHIRLGKREPSPGKHTEMVWIPAGRRKRILQPPMLRIVTSRPLNPREKSLNLDGWGRLGKRSTELITLTEWERIIERILETEVSPPKNFQVLGAFGPYHGRPSRGLVAGANLVRLIKRSNDDEKPEEYRLNEEPDQESEEYKEEREEYTNKADEQEEEFADRSAEDFIF